MSTRSHANLKLAVTSSLQRKDAIEREEAPELSTEEILAGIKRELRSVTVPVFGKVFYHYPLNTADFLELQSKMDDDGSTTAGRMVEVIIALARNSDGTQKFKPEHATALLAAPWDAVTKLASTVMSSHRFTLASAEKK